MEIFLFKYPLAVLSSSSIAGTKAKDQHKKNPQKNATFKFDSQNEINSPWLELLLNNKDEFCYTFIFCCYNTATYNNINNNNINKKAELLKNIYIMSKILPEMFYGVSKSMNKKKLHETNYPIFFHTITQVLG